MSLKFGLLLALILGINALAAVLVARRIKKLESIRKDFIANVSHELRTPITSIKGFSETLLDGDLKDKDEVRHFLEIIKKHSDRLNAIIEDLLSLSKIESSKRDIKFVTCVLSDVLENAIGICKLKASRKGLTIDLCADENLKAKVCPTLIEQASANLIDNAVKYSEEGSRVVVSLYRDGKNIIISVRDFGCGIEKEHLPRLFERFYRVDKARSRKQGGTGLGLAIVKHIAEVHKGTASVESELGKGSKFFVVIPAA